MLGKRKVLCIIPARGDSKNIINKNIKIFMGKPLFEWSVLAAMNSKYIDKILVSSNMEVIKDRIEEIKSELSHCDSEKLEYLQRPDELCGDLSSTEEALIHAVQYGEEELMKAIQYAKDFSGLTPEYIVTLQPTSPIRTDNIVDKALEQIYKEEADSLLSVSKHSPFFFSRKIPNDRETFERGRWKVESTFNYDAKRPMRQQIKNKEWLYHDDGNIYITRREILISPDEKYRLGEKCRLGGYISLFVTDKFQSMQLDDNDDWLLMENVCKLKGGPL